MNILFLLRGSAIGGLEVVTSVLANKFVAEGHHVDIFIFRREDGASVVERLDKRVKVYQQNDYSATNDNVAKLRRILITDKVDVIINQWGLPLTPIKVAKKASKGLGVKIISVYHNAPDANGRVQGITIKLASTENLLKRVMLKVMRWAFREVTSRAMRYNYEQSDRFLVLSDSYIKVFKEFTGLKNTPKLSVMTNPVTIDHGDYVYDDATKQKEILYVGRLDFVQKRVYRVINTWNLLEDKYPNWHLTIVGDGEDRSNLEQHVKAMNLKRVYFEGFKKPNEYYKRASILILTSDFEGFPLVLAEAMSFGVVPVVYDSFAAVRDIIKDGKNGSIVSPVDGVFSAEAMAKPLQSLMDNSTLLTSMAHAAIDESKNYNIDTIYQKWNALLSSLK